MTERIIKVLTVSDIHSVEELLHGLRKEVDRHKPHILACVGDVLDYEANSRGMLQPEDCARLIASMPCEKVVFVRGNHEHFNWFTFEEAWKETKRELVTLHGQAFAYGPLMIVGFPCLLGDEEAFRGNRPELDINPLHWLKPLLRIHGPAVRTLWLMHEPPLGTRLSKESGVIGGNREWMEAVEASSPKVVVFGHDHETPRKHRIWNERLPSGTLCINAGQDLPLRTTLLAFHFNSSKPSLPSKIEARCSAFPEIVQV